jgi:hypothetical protein
MRRNPSSNFRHKTSERWEINRCTTTAFCVQFINTMHWTQTNRSKTRNFLWRYKSCVTRCSVGNISLDIATYYRRYWNSKLETIGLRASGFEILHLIKIINTYGITRHVTGIKTYIFSEKFAFLKLFTIKPKQLRKASPRIRAGIALSYGLDHRGSRVRFPAGAGNFSLHHCIQNGPGAHPASYPMSTRDSFPGSKAAGAWSWPLTSI